MFIIV
jgi:hypothetical protein